MVSTFNFRTSKHRANVTMPIIPNKNVNLLISPGCNAFGVLSDKQIRADFKYCQIKTHVQAACKSHDFNMDLCPFDNGFKKLCITNSIQEYLIQAVNRRQNSLLWNWHISCFASYCRYYKIEFFDVFFEKNLSNNMTLCNYSDQTCFSDTLASARPLGAIKAQHFRLLLQHQPQGLADVNA